MRRLVHAAVLLLVMSVAMWPSGTASADAPPAWFVDESKLPFDALPGTDTARYWGVHSGAGYRIEVPREWNGRLVLWAHEFRGTGLELTVSNPRNRQFLVANGYAWAASSYSANGYAAAQGVKDTYELATLFNGLVATPEFTYITGVQMGGHIAAASLEQFPRVYDGALPICGVLGDFELFDFYLDYILVAQNLAGVDARFPVDPATWTSVTVPLITSTLASAWPSGLTIAGERLKAVTLLRSGGTRPLFDAAWERWASQLFDLGSGDGTIGLGRGVAVDNTDAVYQFDTDPALSPEEQALNDTVLRVAQDPRARVPAGLSGLPVLDGRITAPVLTLHALGDLFVPFSMEQLYAQRVADQGRSHLLVQRAIRGVQHCDITLDELNAGFTDLTGWVERGARPGGDDVRDPAVVAAPTFGCAFTLTTRQLGVYTAPCP